MQKNRLRLVLPYIFLLVGIIGSVSSFVLTYDKIHLLKDPTYVPSCNINPILSCGSVMKTEQASLLGVPNSLFGLMAFSALTVLGLVLLTRAVLSRWLWLLINGAAFAGFAFFLYLFFQGVYRINAICPYCFVIWMIMPPLLWYTTLYNISEGHINLPSTKIKLFLNKHHGDILTVWYLFIFSLLLTHFWYYWRTVL